MKKLKLIAKAIIKFLKQADIKILKTFLKQNFIQHYVVKTYLFEEKTDHQMANTKVRISRVHCYMLQEVI